MMKQLKDPVYGYIKISDEYMYKIVDTDVFQRLRRIVQTSYAPLFSSAVHNRFVHSLGVYYLGVLAVETLRKSLNDCIDFQDIKTRSKEEFIRIHERVFTLACLLHDVGHAPFSHTGERFYLNSPNDFSELHWILEDVVGRSVLPSEKSKNAAPHEIMSAIVGLRRFGSLIGAEDEREFFARCITGYEYENSDSESCIKNIFISLLNSSAIDVDKLDYLLRDALVMGFDTVKIDYRRLLSSLVVFRDKNGRLGLGYDKNAVSVLENVIYARDAEKKWIQNHPVIIYEIYLLQRAISYLGMRVSGAADKALFSEAALGHDSHELTDGIKVRLLSDDDVMYLIKNVYSSRFADEYFMRCARRHPIWKSEVEYRAYFSRKDEKYEDGALERVKAAFVSLMEFMRLKKVSGLINATLEKSLSKDVEELEDVSPNLLREDDLEAQRVKKDSLRLVRTLHQYADEKKLAFDFVILPVKRFISGFGQPKFSEIDIVFKDERMHSMTAKVRDVISSFTARPVVGGEFFYLFYKRGEDSSELPSTQEIVEKLCAAFSEK